MLQTVQKPEYTINIERHQHSFTTPVQLSNLFGTAGRILINLEAAGRNSKQRLNFSEHYKLHGCNAGPSIPRMSIKYSPWHHIAPHDDDHIWSTVDNAQRSRLIIVEI